ncbi:MAG TPA: hypothetical protein VEH80_04275 [Candidatus Bathyarchaeia archaeon]|nr:hypothetical protein [Candidatus Bathyarchaeia archaeon]
MDQQISLLKGRMAEALVEGIFRRARYTVARVGRESQIPAVMRIGRTEFTPDFVVWRALDEPSLGHHSYRLVAIEVKYRAALDDYLRSESLAHSPEIGRQWPELYEIVVTDRPAPGCSCFQAVHVSSCVDRSAPASIDLHLVAGLDIYRKTVEEYEQLVRRIFPILGSRPDAADGGRKPGAWMPGREGHRHRRPRGAAPHGHRASATSEQRQGASE